MKMQAARLYGKEDIRIEQIPVPEIAEDEILLKVKAAALCGTDLRMFQNGAEGVDKDNPLVLCHEFSGIIEKAGTQIDGYKPGQRVSIAPNIGCGICDFCTSGNGHHCAKLIALGVHLDGGFAEYVRIPASAVRLGNVTPLSDNVSFEAGAANEAFACAYNAYEKYGVNPGDTVVIIGAGSIGLMHARLSKMSGAAKIILNDISGERLNECKALEPDVVIVKEKLYERVMEETDGKGAQVVITACGAAAAQQIAFSLGALDGRINFFGGLPKGKSDVELDTNIIHYKQLVVTGTTRSSLFHYRQTLRFLETGLLEIDSLVTHKHPLSDIKKAFENAKAATGLRQIITF